jgi:hypothetical protein
MGWMAEELASDSQLGQQSPFPQHTDRLQGPLVSYTAGPKGYVYRDTKLNICLHPVLKLRKTELWLYPLLHLHGVVLNLLCTGKIPFLFTLFI